MASSGNAPAEVAASGGGEVKSSKEAATSLLGTSNATASAIVKAPESKISSAKDTTPAQQLPTAATPNVAGTSATGAPTGQAGTAASPVNQAASVTGEKPGAASSSGGQDGQGQSQGQSAAGVGSTSMASSASDNKASAGGVDAASTKTGVTAPAASATNNAAANATTTQAQGVPTTAGASNGNLSALPGSTTSGNSASTGTAARSPALATASAAAAPSSSSASGTASPGGGNGGYKPFDYSQPLSTYSPAGPYTSASSAAAAAKRSPAGTPGAVTPTGAPASNAASSNGAIAAASSNPIAAGFTYGAAGAGQRVGSGLNPQNAAVAAASSGSNTAAAAAATPSPGLNDSSSNNRPSPGVGAVQSRTGNTSTPLAGPPTIVSRTSAHSSIGDTSASPATNAVSRNGAMSPLANLPSPAGMANHTALPKQSTPSGGHAQSPPPSQSVTSQAGGAGGLQSRYGAGYTGGLSATASPSQPTRDPRTPNPVTESLLSRSPITAAATSASSASTTAANNAARSGVPAEQSRTGGIATPLAPGSGAPASAAGNTAARQTPGPGSPLATAAPTSNLSKDGARPPSASTTPSTSAPSSTTLSWRSLLERPYPGAYGPSGQGQPNRTSSPAQRAGMWFNPLAVKQQSSAQAHQQAQAQAQAHAQAQAQAQAHAAGQRPPSAGASPAGSPTATPTSAPASATSSAAQANKRRTYSTSAASPPYTMSSIFGGTPSTGAANRPGSTSVTDNTKDGASQAGQQRAVTASPVVGASGAPTSSGSAPSTLNASASGAVANIANSASASNTPGSGGSTSAKTTSGYALSYGERLQQLQAQSVRKREREREREREMRERERIAAAITAGPKSAATAGSPQLSSMNRSPYYGVGGPGAGPASGPSTAVNSAKSAGSPPLSAGTAPGGPSSPQRKAADRPAATSAFGYLFGGGGASRVATEASSSPGAQGRPGLPGSSSIAGQRYPQHPGSAASPPLQQQQGPGGHYRTPSASAGVSQQQQQQLQQQQLQQQQQQQQQAAYRPGGSASSTPVSRTGNTGLGLTTSIANANWRNGGQPNGNAAPGASGVNSQPIAGQKPEVSPQLAAQQAASQKASDADAVAAGQKRKRSDARETEAAQHAAQVAKHQAQQPPPATLHALRQREGPLFTAEDIKGAALRPPLMIVRSDNVVKALHKLSAQHHAASSSSATSTAPFLGRVIYDPFLDPSELLDADLLRRGVGGKVEIWLDTEWLKGEVWEAGAPSHPAVSHPSSPVSDDLSAEEETPNGDDMQLDEDEQPDSRPGLSRRREDLPPAWTLWDLTPLKERKIWGTDVYTDDSDILAACIHSGWLRLGSTAPLFGAPLASDADANQKRRKRRKAPSLDHRSLKITIVVAPKLIKYEGSLRAGVWSRSWGNSHDGVSYAIESVELVEKARHRLSSTRWKAYESAFVPLAKQRCCCTTGCEHAESPALYPRSLKLGEMLVQATS